MIGQFSNPARIFVFAIVEKKSWGSPDEKSTRWAGI
jgi:hypothetical protein